MRVCFVGAYDREYPRNRLLRQGLAAAGVEVDEVRVPERRALLRMPDLAHAFSRAGGGGDLLFVPEFRHKDVPLARILAGPRPLVFDPLVSRSDTLVSDWGLHRPGSAQAWWNRHLDRWTLGGADWVLCDTWAHGRLFESLGVHRRRLRRIAVGAADEFFAVPPRVPDAAQVEVVYAGGFLPLHGVGHVLEAVARLESMHDLPSFRVTLIGDGIEYAAARDGARRLSLSRVEFAGRRPLSEWAGALACSDIVLGAFGTSAKAGRVVPHKVWQGLAAGRAVVSGEGDGPREWFVAGRDLELVPRGDAPALAAALAALIRDRGRRQALADAGRRQALEHGTAAVLGARLRAVFEEALAERRPAA